jgi:hypothetical protein
MPPLALPGLVAAHSLTIQTAVAAWGARGLRVPARNALLADIVPPEVYGRAYGFERAMDNLGAVGGPRSPSGFLLRSACAARLGFRSFRACSPRLRSSTRSATRTSRGSGSASRSASGWRRDSPGRWYVARGGQECPQSGSSRQ